MKTVTVIKDHSFGRQRRIVGQTYDLPDAMAIVYVKAKLVTETPKPVVKLPIPTPPTEDDKPDEPDKAPGKTSRRRYKRRDMISED
ncbi:hypothetical protein EHM92_00225 [bacterium]|nr:MAG: hypothetical protein EHM92_00225 [bacterium]